MSPPLEHPEELLPFYINGSLAGEELRQVEEHLRFCIACRREVQSLRNLQRDFETVVDSDLASSQPPGDDGLARLLEAVDAESRTDPVTSNAPEIDNAPQVENALPPTAPTEGAIGSAPRHRPPTDPGAEISSADEFSRRRAVRLWLPLAAAALLAIAVGLLPEAPGPQPPGPAPNPPIDRPAVERSGNAETPLRSLIPPASALPADDFVLRWEAAPTWQDARFSVRVTTAELEQVAAVDDLDALEYRLPAQALDGLPAQAQLLWRVEALHPDGRRARSPTFLIELGTPAQLD